MTRLQTSAARRQAPRLVLALLLPLGAVALQMTLRSLIHPYVWFLFYPVVFASSWIGGGRAGLVATILSTAFVLWFFVPPEHSFVKEPRQYFPAGVLFAMGCLFAIFHDSLRKAERRAAAALVAAERAAERSRQAEALRESEQRYAAAFDVTSIALALTKMPEGVLVAVNDAFSRIFEFGRDEVLGKTSEELGITDAASQAQLRAQYAARGSVHDFEVVCRTKSGAPRVVLLGLERLTIGGKEHVLTSLQDITERKQAEETARLLERTREIDALKTRFFSGLSHELRTPLTLILGPTERLLRAADTPEPARRDLDVVVRNARTLLGHVNDLLDVAKLEAGRMKPDYAETDLARLVRFAAGHFEVLSKEKDIALEIRGAATLLAQIDPEKVQRVVFNLLANAFKLTPPGGRIGVALRETADRAFLEVGDSGPGIPPDKREAVFEPFRQLEEDAGSHHGGTGLGLSIARELVLLHGGSISISEAPEGGALFVVELPRAAPPGAVVRPRAATDEVLPKEAGREAERIPSEPPRREAPASPASPARDEGLVLVVEDNPEMNHFVSEILSARYRVAIALDGKEGLAKAKSLRPDLILSDVMMPEMTGDELVREIRRCPELDAIPIVLLTAKADEEVRVELLRGGAQDYLLKPFSTEELLARVANLIAKKRSEELVREAEAKVGGILSTSPDAIVCVDDHQRITVFNEAAERVFGYSATEAIGAPLDILIPARFRGAHCRDVERTPSEAATRRMEAPARRISCLRKNGEEFPGDVAISRLDLGGKRILTAVIRDATAQKRAEDVQRLLAEVGSAFASTLDYEKTAAAVANLVVRELADVCIVETVDGEVACRTVAHRDPGLARIGETLREMRLDPGRPHLGSSVLESREPLVIGEVTTEYLDAVCQGAEEQRALRDLAPRSMVSLPLVARDTTIGAMILLRAATPRPYTREDLVLAEELARRAAAAIDNARLYQMARRAVRARDEILGVVAHDLRNPLGNILMQASLMARPGREPERRSRRPAEAIERSAHRMNRLIQDLLAVARAEAGGPSVVRARVPARGIVSDAVEAQRPLVASGSLDLRADVEADLPDVWADRDRILQVLENLIGNAVKFTPPGGQITVGATPGGEGSEDVRFWVRDTGAGIASEDLPHVFDRFWQARKARRAGAGLGLAIAKAIVDAHGGRIWVESTPGRGATFFFTVPTAEQASDRFGDGPRRAARTVLVAEDDPDAREALCNILTRAGYHVAAVSDGAQALEYLHREAPPILVVLDLVLPEVDGWEVLAERDRDPKLRSIPVLVVSGQSGVEDRIAAANAGFMQKPVQPGRLLESVEQVVH